MGQDYGKSAQQRDEGYFQEQLNLYRWRADASVNAHIARVRFASKTRLICRDRLQLFLNQQLSAQNYVDIQKISCLGKEKAWGQGEEVMKFEDYRTTLDTFGESLSFEEIFYVLQVLLGGFETIFRKFGKVHIAGDCCFVTERGEVRVWINSNAALNEFPESDSSQTGQSGAVYEILRLCDNLTWNHGQFWHFHNQLRLHFGQDVLHNLGFFPTRKFVNGYIYSRSIAVPQNLYQILAKIKSKHNSYHATPLNRGSSLSQLIEPEETENMRLLSTGQHLVNPKMSYFEGRSSEGNGESRHFQFYRPNQKLEKKLSNLDLNAIHFEKRSLNRSEIVKQQSAHESMSSSFSKKNGPEYLQLSNAMNTPKNTYKSRTHLQSTNESFYGHSRDTNGFAASKMVNSRSTMNLLQRGQTNSRFEKKQNKLNVGFYMGKKNREDVYQYQTAEQVHSRQPSFDEKCSSLFVSPASEMVHFEDHVYRQPDLSKLQAVSESELSNPNESYNDRGISTMGQMSPSAFLTRQVSGLVQSEDIHMFQSKGSLLSHGSSMSQYRGVLLGLCQSAKILNIPTNKRLSNTTNRRLQVHPRSHHPNHH